MPCTFCPHRMRTTRDIWSTSARSGWRRRVSLNLCSNAKQIFVPNSSEYVQFDAPDTVIDAIREVYAQSK